MIDQNQLKELLSYNPDTGVFIWLKSYNNAVTGKQAKTKGRNGYIDIKIKGVRYYAHRLAWLYMTGEQPKNVIDHIDRDKTNNKFNNLRDVSVKENINNQIKPNANNSTGVRGVMPYINGYSSQISVNGKNIHLGVFKSIEDAEAAYICAKNIFAPLPRKRP